MITHEKFFDKPFNDKSVVRLPSQKYISTDNHELANILNTINKLAPRKIETNSNISLEEENALKETITLTKVNIEIKKADKSNTLVIIYG